MMESNLDIFRKDYLNANTWAQRKDGVPLELLNNLERLEKKLGRTGKGNYLPRSIDIDILLYGDEVVETAELTIPHPHLADRAFVIDQLLSLDAALLHPKLRMPIKALKADAT